MKINNIFLVSIFLLAILSVCAVSATDNLTVIDEGDYILESPQEDMIDDMGLSEDSVLSDNDYITVKLTDNSFKVGSSAELDVSVKENVTGTLTYYMDDPSEDSTGTEDVNGSEWKDFCIYVPVSDFGKHTINVKYSEGNYPDKTFSFPITVDDYKLDVYYDSFDGEPVPYAENALFFVSASAPEGALTVTVNGKTYNVYYDSFEGWSESISIKKEDIKYGFNEMAVKYVPKDKTSPFKAKTINTNFTAASRFILTQNGVNNNNAYGTGIITLTMPSDAKGNVIIALDNKNYTITPSNGKYVFNIPKLDLKEYTLEARYIGGDYNVYYGEDLNCMEFYLNVVPNLNVPDKVWVNNDVVFAIEMPEKYTGNAVIQYNYYDERDVEQYSDPVKVEIKNGKASHSFRLPVGSYWFDVNITAGDYKLDSSLGVNVEVSDDDPNWKMDLETPKMIRQESDVLLTHIPSFEPSTDEKNFILKIDGNDFDCEIGNEIIIDASKLSIGKHTFTLSFLGDGYYMPTNESGSFEVGTVAVNIPDVNYVDDYKYISIELPKGTSGTVTLLADNKQIYSEKVADGAWEDDNCLKMDIALDSLKCGISTVVVKLNGNEIATGKVESTYILASISESLRYGGDKLYIQLPDDSTGKLHVEIDGVPVEVTTVMDDGRIDEEYVWVSDLSVGIHNITLSHTGDKKYPDKQTSSTFEVSPKFIFEESVNKGEGLNLVMPSDAKGNVVIYINGEVYAKVKAAGNVSVNFDNLSYGQYSLSMYYDGDDYKVDSRADESLTVNPEFIIPERMLLKGNDVISISLPANEKGRLAIWWGEKEYEAQKELVNGKASIPLSMLTSGNKTLDVYFYQYYSDEDNGEYERSFQTVATINVVNPLTVKDTSVLYSQSSKYTVNVKDINGNPVASGSVTINVLDGSKKILTKTVNIKNGVATLRYKITQGVKTYKIKTTYQKSSVTKKLAVKHVVNLKKVTVKKSAKSLALTATLKKVNGKYIKGKAVTFKFNGKTYKAKTNSKGVAKVTVKKAVLSKLKVGKKISYQATYIKDTVKKSVKVLK